MPQTFQSPKPSGQTPWSALKSGLTRSRKGDQERSNLYSPSSCRAPFQREVQRDSLPEMRSPRAPVKTFSAIPVAVGLAMSQVAVAAPPDHRDPALAPWFESLNHPGSGAPCCSIADCRTTEFRHDRDGYEVLSAGRWTMSVPFCSRDAPNTITSQLANPHARHTLS